METSQLITMLAVLLPISICIALAITVNDRKADARFKRLEHDVHLIMKHLGVQTATEQALGARGAEIDALLRRGRKIEAIKVYRELTGVGLKEAKNAVDAFQAGR